MLKFLPKLGDVVDALFVLCVPLMMTLIGLYLTHRGDITEAMIVGCAGIVMFHNNARDRVKRNGYF